MYVRDNVLEVTRHDQAGYMDIATTLYIGSTVEVKGQRYRIKKFHSMDLAFGGNRVYFDVEELPARPIRKP